ncbi:uncharacterized protein EAF02_008865 [Botrytis sinoallii]|uniref:uncharacterized protein n=1 Tax=Botrytis sinoallii TaxID=1463999 RepID=UPI0018FF4773|nr:uncharacterized protein EAF02_008865 [Botrytis sinoallii]KAF7872794.1 hypothetical protein EAF02_008865 [Botrytis sinoallii]
MNRKSSFAYPPTHAAYSASASTSNASAPRHNQNFPHPSLNLQRSSEYSPSPTYSTYASNSTSASYVAAEYVIPETTRSSPVQKTRHRKSGSSSRLYQDSCSSDTCSQPSLPPTPPPFNARPTREWLSQLPGDISVRSTAQDTKRVSRSSRYREASGTSDRSTSGLSSPEPISVGSSSRSGGRPRVSGLYVEDYDIPKMRPLISRAARKKETAEKQAVARLSAGRQIAESPTADREKAETKTLEEWKEWQNDEEYGGWF